MVFNARRKSLAVAGVAIMALVSMPVIAQQAPQGTTDEDAHPAPRNISQVEAKALRWPLPASVDKSFDTIDGERMKADIEELATISRRYRDEGNVYWGRLAGLKSGAETQAWVTEKFRQIPGLQIETKPYTMPTQHIPQSFGISVSGNGKSLQLSSAFPLISFATTMPAPQGDEVLDAAWVGLGTEADFLGRDVKGKAVFIYSMPTPSSLVQSASWNGAALRAQKAGAKAIVVQLAIPGNMKYVSHLVGVKFDPSMKLPIFTIGRDDGDEFNALYASMNGKNVKVRVSWNVKSIDNLKAANVIATLPGQTDEAIVMIAHTDGFFDGGADDGAGTAALLETARFFANMPKEKRRRTMYFIATPDHHGGDFGGAWIHQNMQPILKKTAVIMNAEHVALMEPVWDRKWGSTDKPSLMPTNGLSPSWWGVYGSDRLAHIVADSFALFGVPTQIGPGGSPGELRQVQFDAPSFYLHNKNVFYHSDADTPAVVPADGMRTAVQAFAKIFEDVNQLDLTELRAPPEQ
jgi:hypothetical protein